jgi:hypothetical protein
MDSIACEVQAILDGFTTGFNGWDVRGVYNNSAKQAIEEVTRVCEGMNRDRDAHLVIMDASDYLADDTKFTNRVKADSSNYELELLAKEVINSCEYTHVDVIEGVLKYLTSLRNAMKEE